MPSPSGAAAVRLVFVSWPCAQYNLVLPQCQAPVGQFQRMGAGHPARIQSRTSSARHLERLPMRTGRIIWPADTIRQKVDLPMPRSDAASPASKSKAAVAAPSRTPGCACPSVMLVRAPVSELSPFHTTRYMTLRVPSALLSWSRLRLCFRTLAAGFCRACWSIACAFPGLFKRPQDAKDGRGTYADRPCDLSDGYSLLAHPHHCSDVEADARSAELDPTRSRSMNSRLNALKDERSLIFAQCPQNAQD